LQTRASGSHHHYTIADWQMQQVEKWGLTEGYIYNQVNGYLNTIKKADNYNTGSAKGIELGIIWINTGMTLID
jgi:hypothetical protein